MCPAMAISKKNEDAIESLCQNGVKHLCDTGISKIPNKYVLPVHERPNTTESDMVVPNGNLKLPVIDFAELQGPNRARTLETLANACEQYGFFQLVNHGIPGDVITGIIDVAARFFELPYEERSKYMSSNFEAPVRYGTSFNQNKDNVFTWRDFLKLTCNHLPDVLPHWPSSPVDLRTVAVTYAEETKILFLMVMEAILETLSGATKDTTEDDEIMKEFQDGSQLMIVNCYPPCPEPHLTLGMPPHSDYGFLTFVLQDEVKGLQIQHEKKWVTVEPIPNSFVVNVGDHLEIFSNGRYKSVLHRVAVNAENTRISVASLHSLEFKSVVKPWPKLIDEANPRRYRDTDFASFLAYMSSCEPKKKSFLESRMIVN